MNPAVDVGRWISTQAEFCPDKVALRFEDSILTYRDFSARCAQLASLLRTELDLAPGARVAYLGANLPDTLTLFFACAMTRVIFVPLNWRLAAPELDSILADCTPAALFDEDSCAELASLLKYTLPKSHCHRLPFEAAVSAQVTRNADADVFDPRTPLLLVYTSGTTGAPKGAVLSHRALQMNALNSIHMHALTADDVILTTLPLFHVGGLNIQTTPALAIGAEVVLTRRFDAASTLATIAVHRPTLTVQVPATSRAIFAEADFASTDLTSLRALTTGSTDVPRELIAGWHQRGVPVVQVYGATETAPLAIYQRIADAYSTAGSIGRAGLHTEIKLVLPDGSACNDATPGEIWVRGEHVATRYWNNANADTFCDGWFRSGDVAERDHAGVFWFKDRLKNVIISGGENIYPAELERILNTMPGIVEAAVVGVADPRWGAAPVAVIVTNEPTLSCADVLHTLAQSVARYKLPKHVLFVANLPRTALGKVNTASLRQMVAEKLHASN